MDPVRIGNFMCTHLFCAHWSWMSLQPQARPLGGDFDLGVDRPKRLHVRLLVRCERWVRQHAAHRQQLALILTPPGSPVHG
jgi:hypothetical protein